MMMPPAGSGSTTRNCGGGSERLPNSVPRSHASPVTLGSRPDTGGMGGNVGAREGRARSYRRRRRPSDAGSEKKQPARHGCQVLAPRGVRRNGDTLWSADSRWSAYPRLGRLPEARSTGRSKAYLDPSGIPCRGTSSLRTGSLCLRGAQFPRSPCSRYRLGMQQHSNSSGSGRNS